MRTRRILLYKNGEADRAAMGELGCYEKWFERALPGHVRLEVHRGFDAPRRPLSGYEGLLLSGSPRSLAEREPWMDEAAEFVRHAAQAGVPVLGVCFGHQLIGHAFGARAQRCKKGWEAGTTTVRLTDAGRRDPLFLGTEDSEGRLTVNQSHRDEVAPPTGESSLLAENDHSAVQALGFRTHVRGVQFHPEMRGAEVRRLLGHRRALLDADADAKGRPELRTDALLRCVTDTPSSQRVLANWLDHFVNKS